MGRFNRTQEMSLGGEIRCFNCRKKLLQHLEGSNYNLELECERCKTRIVIYCREPIPFKEVIKEELQETR